MGTITAHYNKAIDVPEDNDNTILSVHPASKEAVELVSKATEDGMDGRSNWVWVRLTNGDLMLAVYPQGETYMAVEYDAQYPT